MAKWAQRYKTPTNAKEEFLKAVEAFAEAYPEVAAVLAGTYLETGEIETPPFGVRLFINGGVLKFQISRKDDPLSGFGVISNPENILDSIESALSKDEVGWKANSAQTLPY
jgi:hypothetical protein